MADTYSTRDEAIQREIVEPILAGDVDSIDEYDVPAIADAVLGDHSQGYACQVDAEEFWQIVHRNAVLARLNDYDGDNLWEDVIYGLDYNEAATNEVEHGDGRDVVIGGIHYRHEGGEWIVKP